MPKFSVKDALIWFAVLFTVCVALLLVQGCGVRDEVPDFGAGYPREAYFPKGIPAGYGPRANECAERDAYKQALDGIGAAVVGNELHLTWSEPCENTSNLPATCVVKVAFHCSYGANGKQNLFEDGDSVLVMPNKMRLAKGVIKIPLDCIERKYTGGISPERWFDRKNVQRNWTGIMLSGPGSQLEFIWAGEDPDGTVRLRWISLLTSVTHKITAKADNAKTVTLDTGAYDLEVVCVLVDKDGKEVARDTTKVDGKAGAKEAAGWFRIKMTDALNMDWDKCKADWIRLLPDKVGRIGTGNRKVRMLVTAYDCGKCCTDGDNITASNTDATLPGIAADWRALHKGAILSIPGYGKAVVDDTGGAMRRSYKNGIVHIDVRMKTHWQARQWGRQWLEVEVL